MTFEFFFENYVFKLFKNYVVKIILVILTFTIVYSSILLFHALIIHCIYRQSPIFLLGPTVTRLAQEPLSVLFLDNQLSINRRLSFR